MKDVSFPRPRWLIILALVFLLFSLMGWLRVRETLSVATLLAHTYSFPAPEFLVLIGIAWGLVGLPASAGLFFGWHWADKLAWGATAFYLATFWLDRFLLVRAVEGRANSLFLAGLSGLWVLATFLVLRSQPAQNFLHRREKK